MPASCCPLLLFVPFVLQTNQVAIKVVDLLCAAPADTQVLLQQVTAMVQHAAACPAGVCCEYEGVCLRGHQLLLVMRRYSRSLAAAIAREQQQSDNGDVDDTGTGGGLPLSLLLHRCSQVLSVLVGLHSCGMAAVDLKPSNLLLTDTTAGPQQQQQGQSRPASSSTRQVVWAWCLQTLSCT